MATMTVSPATTASASREQDWTAYDDTERVKVVCFNAVSTVGDTIELSRRAWEIAVRRYARPLVQVRVILPVSEQEALLQAAAVLSPSPTARVWVAGRIPFRVDEEMYAIYAVHLQQSGRPVYRTDSFLHHGAALQRGLQRSSQQVASSVAGEIEVMAVQFAGGSPRDVVGDRVLALHLSQVAEELATLHRAAFEWPHDPAQQTADGIRRILERNPVLLACTTDGRIVSAGLVERDERFTFAGLALLEPTCFTDPDPRYRGHGLSSRVLRLARCLVEHDGGLMGYDGAPAILFAEAVRESAFGLCIANGWHLAATRDLRISGDLGDAYTAIGPANPATGFMPMGLTYLADPRVRVEPDDCFMDAPIA